MGSRRILQTVGHIINLNHEYRQKMNCLDMKRIDMSTTRQYLQINIDFYTEYIHTKLDGTYLY